MVGIGSARRLLLAATVWAAFAPLPALGAGSIFDDEYWEDPKIEAPTPRPHPAPPPPDPTEPTPPPPTQPEPKSMPKPTPVQTARPTKPTLRLPPHLKTRKLIKNTNENHKAAHHP